MVRRLSSQIGKDEKMNKVRSLRIMERQEFSFNASVLCWGKFGILFKNDKYAKPSKERCLQRCLLKFAHSKKKKKVTVRNLSPHEEKAAQSHPGITEHHNTVTPLSNV